MESLLPEKVQAQVGHEVGLGAPVGEGVGTSGVRQCAAGVPLGAEKTGASQSPVRYRSGRAEGPQDTTPGGAQAVRGQWEGGQVPGDLGHWHGGLFPRSSWEGRQNCGEVTGSEQTTGPAMPRSSRRPVLCTYNVPVLDFLSQQLSG